MKNTNTEIKAFFHQSTNTICYVVSDKETKCAAIIDSCLDYDHADGSLDTEHADTVIEYLKTENLKLLPGKYEVEVSSKNISHFKNGKTQYWIALEPESTYKV